MRRAILTTWGQWATTGLVLLGLLLTPVTCALVVHPHSLFLAPEAVERSGPPPLPGHADHARSTAVMVGGQPPLAGIVPLPRLHAGTVLAWLTVSGVSRVSGDAVGGNAPVLALPDVSPAAMTMVASGLNALPVTLVLLLAVALVAVRPFRGTVALRGRTLAVIAPPPKPLASV